MKKLFLIPLLFLTYTAFGQSAVPSCEDLDGVSCCSYFPGDFTPEMVEWKDVGCKTAMKAAEYDLFPKMLEYKGYGFRDISSCAVQNMDNSLVFQYCIPLTRQHMEVTIIDLKDPFFETENGKAVKDIHLFAFNSKENAITLGMIPISSTDRKFKNSFIASARFSPYGGEDDGVSYGAYVNDRYYITIDIGDKQNRYTAPGQVEEFIKDYVSQINLSDQ